MNYTIRPLGPWLDPITKNRRGAHLFRVTWDRALDVLGQELDKLKATNVVIQVDVTDAELRRDGMLRTYARVGFPGIRVSFDSRHGPLTYCTDAYDRIYGHGMQGWQANVYAVALGLEALRAVDRYGISGRGQQYRGWTAIESRPHQMSVEEAAVFIAHHAAGSFTPSQILADRDRRDRAFRMAAGRLHPDRGTDGDTMAQLSAARALIERAR